MLLWILVSLAATLIEIRAQRLYAVFFAASAFVTGIFFSGLAVAAQIIVFVLMGVVLMIMGRRRLVRLIG